MSDLDNKGGASLVGSVVKNPPAMQERQETWVQSLSQEDPLEKGMAIHSRQEPGESHGERSLVDYSPRGHKELDTTEATEHAQHTRREELERSDVRNSHFLLPIEGRE